MLSSAARARLAVVLVGARNPQNIGAAARAMQDFGFSDLRFVNPYTAPFEAAQLEAVRSAVGASEVMRNARSFAALPEALADCTLVAGTTAVGGRTLEQTVVSIGDAAPLIREHLQQSAADSGGTGPPARLGLLFGSEKTGLSKEQLSYCRLLTTIPLFTPAQSTEGGARHLSMNLGQAVAVCLYELVRAGFEGARELPKLHRAPANGEDRQRLGELLLELVRVSEYARRFPANARERVVRRLAQQLGETHDEAATWMGILRQAIAAARRS